jgi:hypothetical protein
MYWSVPWSQLLHSLKDGTCNSVHSRMSTEFKNPGDSRTFDTCLTCDWRTNFYFFILFFLLWNLHRDTEHFSNFKFHWLLTCCAFFLASCTCDACTLNPPLEAFALWTRVQWFRIRLGEMSVGSFSLSSLVYPWTAGPCGRWYLYTWSFSLATLKKLKSC